MIIGKRHAHNFSAYICFAWFLYTLISPALHGNQQKMTFFAALPRVMYHSGKVYNENAAYGI